MFELKKLVDKTEMEHKVKLQKSGAGITTNTGRVNAVKLFIYTNS
jgi:DNA methyltransferase 1-associated protein 1